MSKERQQVLDEISKERDYQKTQWSDKFDSENTPNDWVSYIVRYAGNAVVGPWNPLTFRTALIKVAAICVAAVEWCDMTNGKMPKRHYDE